MKIGNFKVGDEIEFLEGAEMVGKGDTDYANAGATGLITHADSDSIEVDISYKGKGFVEVDDFSLIRRM